MGSRRPFPAFFYNARLGGAPSRGAQKATATRKGRRQSERLRRVWSPQGAPQGTTTLTWFTSGVRGSTPGPGNELDYSQMIIAPSLDEVGRLIGEAAPSKTKPSPQQKRCLYHRFG